MNQGWQCPACKTVHAPHVERCDCSGRCELRTVHYGVKQKTPYYHPGACGAVSACSMVCLGSTWTVTRDWNDVTCRRCMKSRAVAARDGCRSMAAVRIALVMCAPPTPADQDFIWAETRLDGSGWDIWDPPEPESGGYGCAPCVGERCTHAWTEYFPPLPRCTLLAGHEGPHKPDR